MPCHRWALTCLLDTESRDERYRSERDHGEDHDVTELVTYRRRAYPLRDSSFLTSGYPSARPGARFQRGLQREADPERRPQLEPVDRLQEQVLVFVPAPVDHREGGVDRVVPRAHLREQQVADREPDPEDRHAGAGEDMRHAADHVLRLELAVSEPDVELGPGDAKPHVARGVEDRPGAEPAGDDRLVGLGGQGERVPEIVRSPADLAVRGRGGDPPVPVLQRRARVARGVMALRVFELRLRPVRLVEYPESHYTASYP